MNIYNSCNIDKNVKDASFMDYFDEEELISDSEYEKYFYATFDNFQEHGTAKEFFV